LDEERVAMYFGNLGPYIPRNTHFGGHPTLTNNLFSYWKFEEQTTAIDAKRRDAHQGRDLTTSAVTVITTGKSGYGYRPPIAPATLRRTTSDFNAVGNMTISAWVSTVNFDTIHTFASMLSPTAWQVRGVAGATDVEARLYSTTDNVAATSSSYVHGQFNHVLAEFNGSSRTASISINGEALTTSSATTGTTLEQGTIFQVGNGVTTLYVLDEIGIWARLLTLDERIALYSGGTGLFY
jgi:hypothetical protein